MSAVLLERLVRASVEGGLLVFVVALICRLVPSLQARHRAALWWLAAAKLLVALAPIQPLELPLLPPGGLVAETSSAKTRVVTIAPSMMGAASQPSASPERWLAGFWAGGFLVLSTGSLIGAIRARRLRRSGRPLDDAAIRAEVADAARKLGLKSAPEVLLVPGLEGPLLTGLVTPAILLPESAARQLTPAELEMAALHELAHVARRDLWLGLVPAAARRVFFFHPLAWWIEREYAIAREAACDDAVLTRGGADAFTYGRLLLRLATGRPAGAAAFSPRSMLRRRLEMIERTKSRKPLRARIVWALVALAAAGFVPLKLVAREAPAPEAPPAPAVEATAPAPAATPSSEATPAPVAEPTRAPIARSATPMAPPPLPATTAPRATPPPAPVAPPAPAPRATTVTKRSATYTTVAPRAAPEAAAPPEPPEAPEPPAAPERCLDLGNAKDTAFVITNGDSHTMCGDLSDIRDAEHARGTGDDVVWFRVDGQSYVIRDRGTVTEAREAFRAQNMIGTEQSKVGDIQAAIGDKQAAIGDKQARLAEAQERLAKELSASGRSVDLQAKMDELSRRMDELNRHMQELGEQQSELGIRQNALGNKMMLEGSAAQRRLTEILERALESGRAAKID